VTGRRVSPTGVIPTLTIRLKARIAQIFVVSAECGHRRGRLVIGELAPKHRCVAMDLRGWGGSAEDVGDFGLQAQADDVLSLIGRLGLETCVVVGHTEDTS
jgi:pimeloyl-ACP methyl ester carboxylesterase